MAKITPFENYSEMYEAWFEDHSDLYAAELQTIQEIIGNRKDGVDIGMGSGIFALPLGIVDGVEPSQAMRDIALSKGLHPVEGVAEALPYTNETFQYALMVTVICFVDDPLQALREAYRILRYGGSLIVGIIDKDSPMGKRYADHKNESRFYSDATFYSVEEIVSMASEVGFSAFSTNSVKGSNDSFIFIECLKS